MKLKAGTWNRLTEGMKLSLLLAYAEQWKRIWTKEKDEPIAQTRQQS